VQRGRRYWLSFRTAADAPAELDVCLQGDEPPYRILHLARLAAGPEPRQYTLVTPEAPDAGRMRLAFWFGNGATGTYWLDDVAARELSEEEAARLAGVPEGFRNGDFSAGLEGWELRVHDGAEAELSLDPRPRLGDGNCGRVTVAKSTETGWHVQLMEIFQVRADRRYRAKFAAMAERPAEITVSFQVPPPDNETLSSQRVSLSAEPQAFAVTSARTRRGSDMKLSFHLSGAGEGDFWVDSVSVEELALNEGDDAAQ